MTKAAADLIERSSRKRGISLVTRDLAPTVIPTVRGLRKVCFVSGTRAEFGLMRSTLRAIQERDGLGLQIVCTGMHLDPVHGRTIDTVRAEGWTVDAEVPWEMRGNAASKMQGAGPAPTTPVVWPASAGSSARAHDPGMENRATAAPGTPGATAAATGRAIARLAETYDELGTDVVLVVGDRVEAFAAATAGLISGRVVAHVHGGDRALGQVDDSLRHAISKLAHLHFPATAQSARRLKKMGEDPWRVVRAGSPGVDEITKLAADWSALGALWSGCRRRGYALLVLHPTGADAGLERERAETVARAATDAGLERVVVVYPNNDPGAAGIIGCWDALRGDERFVFRRDVPRAEFLGLMRDAAVMVGNSSSGIIEAASFGTPVIDVGPRQSGRERGANVTNVSFDRAKIAAALSGVWNGGRPRRHASRNVYGGGGAGGRIANALARVAVNDRLLRKLVAY